MTGASAGGWLALVAAVAVGCGDPVVLSPIIEAPTPGSEADPFPNLDEIELSVARAGEPGAMVLSTIARGNDLELAGVPYGDDLVIHMVGRVSSTPIAYGRTCTFDLIRDETPPEVHLYFSRTVKWATRGTPPTATRSYSAAAAARDGSGVFFGSDSDGSVGLIDRFDARTGGFAPVGDTLAPRTSPAVATLGDGRLLVVGGRDPTTSAPASFFEVVDPLASQGNIVDRIEGTLLAREELAAVTLSDGRVVVIGGRDAVAPMDTTIGLGLDGGDLAVELLRGKLGVPRYAHTATRLGDGLGAPVLVVGGLDAAGLPVATAELYKPLIDAFSPLADFAPTLTTPRHHHVAVRTPDGGVLVVGGLGADGQPVRTLELFAFDTGFDAVLDLPNEAGVVDQSITVLPDGRILLAGGRETPGGPPLASAFIIQVDPLDGTVDVLATDALGEPRAGHQAVALCDGTVLLAGGAASGTTERYNPPPAGRR